MNFKKIRRAVASGARKSLHYIQPIARVVESATSAIGAVQKPTPLGVINAVTGGISTLGEVIAPSKDQMVEATISTWLTSGQIVGAMRAIGARTYDAVDKTMVEYDNYAFAVNKMGYIWFMDGQWSEEVMEFIRRALDAHLPSVLRLGKSQEENEKSSVEPASLTHLTPPQAPAILERTKRLLGRHRTILLEGRPGIGKTTAAQAMARDAGLGRVLLLDNAMLQATNLKRKMYHQLSLGVIVVDDIDKVSISLSAIERLRDSCRLLILTANNGAYDSVLDAALSRPARIDEVFRLTAARPFKRPPFDRLTDAQWAVVSEWPQAYLNELELRLLHTPEDLRIEDLLGRLAKRTRSGGELLDGDGPDVDIDLWLQQEEETPIVG